MDDPGPTGRLRALSGHSWSHQTACGPMGTIQRHVPNPREPCTFPIPLTAPGWLQLWRRHRQSSGAAARLRTILAGAASTSGAGWPPPPGDPPCPVSSGVHRDIPSSWRGVQPCFGPLSLSPGFHGAALATLLSEKPLPAGPSTGLAVRMLGDPGDPKCSPHIGR